MRDFFPYPQKIALFLWGYVFFHSRENGWRKHRTSQGPWTSPVASCGVFIFGGQEKHRSNMGKNPASSLGKKPILLGGMEKWCHTMKNPFVICFSICFLHLWSWNLDFILNIFDGAKNSKFNFSGAWASRIEWRWNQRSISCQIGCTFALWEFCC